MGYNRPQWKFVNKCFRETGLLLFHEKLPKAGTVLKEEKYYEMSMLELGCQQIREFVRNSLQSKSTAKSYFKSIGIKSISIDIKGCNYSKVVDLREPMKDKYHDKFDIVTNSGTTEHIIPLKGQYQAFKNIHNCAKKGAVMIHILPGVSKYYGHCQTYYSFDFFRTLAELSDYKIVLMEHIKNREFFTWMGICLIKNKDNKFTNDKKKFFKNIQFVDKKIVKKHRKIKLRYFKG